MRRARGAALRDRDRPAPAPARDLSYTTGMAQDTARHDHETPHGESPYREPHVASGGGGGVDGPREVLGRFTAPLIGEVDAELGLGRAIRVELDREGLELQPGSGLVLRAGDLPTVELRRLQVDLVHGVVHSEAAALGPFFDRVLTVALCSALRHSLGWAPGTSIAEHAARRLKRPLRADGLPVWAQRRFPRARLGLDPATRVALEIEGAGVELRFSRPALLRVLGVGLQVVMVRFAFATGRLELRSTAGPLRRWLLRVVGFFLNRWLRPRLPAAMRVPGYDLFADEGRRGHLRELLRRLRGSEVEDAAGGRSGMGAGAGRAPHEQARAGRGERAGFAGVVSLGKAAVFAALQTLRVSADDMPELTRPLFRVPLGPFSGLALCTDRGGAVTLIKQPGGARLEAPLGLYLFADQFPELAELRVRRIVVLRGEDGELGFDLQTDPPLGALLRALLQRLTRAQLLPRLPLERLRAGGALDGAGGAHHVLWRQSLGPERELVLRTAAGAELRLAHEDEALVLSAPEGLELRFEGLPVPPATLKRLAYRWADGAIEADGTPALGPFGQELLARLAQARIAPLAPRGLGLPAVAAPELDPEIERAFPALLLDLPVPVLGRLQLRMDPGDTLAVELRPADIDAHSERGVVLVAVDMKLMMTIRGARHALPRRQLTVDAEPAPGAYVEALAGLCIEALAMPALRRLLPMWPDVPEDDEARWELAGALRGALAERLGVAVRLSLPPGAALSLRRAPDALELGATAPLRVEPEAPGLIGEFAVRRLRWQPAGERIGLLTLPPAGPLAHDLARRVLAALTPDLVSAALARRLALPAPTRPPPPLPTPVRPPLFEISPPLLGTLALQADTEHALDLSLRREGAELRCGAGMVLRASAFDLAVTVRRVEVNFLPFTVQVDAAPVAGELEGQLVTHALRGLFARFMGLFWPSDRSPRPEGEVLLALGGGQPWGPIELCVGPGGALGLHLDPTGLVLEAAAGLFVAGGALGWLPGFHLHRLAYDFSTGAVQLRISGVAQRRYHEIDPVGPLTESIVSHLARVLLAPRLPVWTQRLGMRVLPPPPPLDDDPERVAVWRFQLPLGYARIELMMDPGDVLRLRASREELAFESARGLRVEVPGLQLRVPFTHVRYHMHTGEVQVSGLGQLENALAEAVLRHELTRVDPTAAEPDEITLADVLDRFPVDDQGRRQLFADKLVRVLLDPYTTIVAVVEPGGLRVAAEPGLKLDGVAGLDYLFAGLRYSFADAAFHLDIERDGLLAGALRGLVTGEAEAVLNSLLRPLLPRAMRTPGYSLAADPEPSATLAALLRVVSLGKLARFSAS